jgi:hypothetical protein
MLLREVCIFRHGREQRFAGEDIREEKIDMERVEREGISQAAI